MGAPWQEIRVANRFRPTYAGANVGHPSHSCGEVGILETRPDSLHPLPPGVVSRTLANYLESAHMADVIGSVHLDLKSVWIKELERFLRLGVRKFEVHFR